MCRTALEPFTGPLGLAGLQAVTGAGDALARTALDGRISAAQARSTLTAVVLAVAGGSPKTAGTQEA